VQEDKPVTSSHDRDAVKPRKTLGGVIGFTLLYLFVASWFVWGPFGLISYVDGLFNSLAVFFLVPVLLVLIPLAVICLVVLVMRMALHWREFPDGEKRRRLIGAAVPFAFLLSFGMGCVGLQPTPAEMFVRGFAGYAERRMDVTAVQNWLSTLDPNTCVNEGGYAQERRLMPSEQPPHIAYLGPKWATLRPDGSGRLRVRLLWGGGFIGHWGIVIGPPDMPTPPSDPSTSREERLPLAPGAYVWSGD
jgi:hypothetical protein